MEDNEQLMQFINWLQQTKFPDASVEQVAQQVQAMSQDPQGQQELQSLVQEFQQSTGMFKKGGKIDQLVEKRKKIRKAKEGTTVPETESKKKTNNPYKNHKYVQQEYWGPNKKNVQIITATERNLLPVNQAKDPNSDWNVGMGEYDGDHLILDADKNGIKSIRYGFGTQSNVDPRLHDADSVAALNQIIARMKVAGIPLGFPLVKNPDYIW